MTFGTDIDRQCVVHTPALITIRRTCCLLVCLQLRGLLRALGLKVVITSSPVFECMGKRYGGRKSMFPPDVKLTLVRSLIPRRQCSLATIFSARRRRLPLMPGVRCRMDVRE